MQLVKVESNPASLRQTHQSHSKPGYLVTTSCSICFGQGHVTRSRWIKRARTDCLPGIHKRVKRIVAADPKYAWNGVLVLYELSHVLYHEILVGAAGGQSRCILRTHT